MPTREIIYATIKRTFLERWCMAVIDWLNDRLTESEGE